MYIYFFLVHNKIVKKNKEGVNDDNRIKFCYRDDSSSNNSLCCMCSIKL